MQFQQHIVPMLEHFLLFNLNFAKTEPDIWIITHRDFGHRDDPRNVSERRMVDGAPPAVRLERVVHLEIKLVVAFAKPQKCLLRSIEHSKAFNWQ